MRQRPLSGVFEDNFARRGALTGETAFVHEAVVLAAELHQVFQTGLTASAPVLNVMGVDKLLPGTTRKAATVVAKP
jgi:hypothetical protein